MRIGNNISAMNTLNRLTVNNSMLSKSLEKLSSGSAINRAADNAAGLAISEKMRAQIAGLEQASKNAQDGISLVQTAEGALDQTHTALRRMYTLAMQAKNGTITAEDRQKIQDEIDARINEIDRVSVTSNFNGIKLFDGSLDGSPAVDGKAPTAASSDDTKVKVSVSIANEATETSTELLNAINSLKFSAVYDSGATGDKFTLTGIADGDTVGTYTIGVDDDEITLEDGAGNTVATINLTGVADGTSNISFAGGTAYKAAGTGTALELQIGATADAADKIDVNISKMDAKTLLGLGATETTLDMSTADKAGEAIGKINAAIEKVSSQRASLGAVQNRLEQTIENLSTTAENMSAAESRIRDVDMAKEMTTFTKYSILSQAAQAMLAQANALPQGVLQLLG